MKVSEINDAALAEYLKLEYTDLTAGEVTELNTLLDVSKAFILGYTGLTAEEVDTHEDFVIVVYVLVQDMHDNRVLYIEKNNLNKVVDTILGMHSVNLL